LPPAADLPQIFRQPDLTRARAYGFWDKNYRDAITLSQILPVKKSSYLAVPVFNVIVGYGLRALHPYKCIDSKRLRRPCEPDQFCADQDSTGSTRNSKPQRSSSFAILLTLSQ
jgi:hypothetical protein